MYLFEKENHVLQTKVVELETLLAQQTKDFEDAKTDFFNKTTKFENYFERLEKENIQFERKLARKTDDSKAEKDQFLKQIASLESKLASQDNLSLQKEYNDLRTSYNALKAKFDALNRSKGKSHVSNESKPQESLLQKFTLPEPIELAGFLQVDLLGCIQKKTIRWKILYTSSSCALFLPDLSELKKETEKYVFAYKIRISLKPERCIDYGRFSDSGVLIQIHLIIKSNENVVGDINEQAMIDKLIIRADDGVEFVCLGRMSCPTLPGSVEGSLTFIPTRMGGVRGNPLMIEVAKFPLLLPPDYIF
ncbi:SKP1/ASK-interacting protein 16 [Artemisia annua]|uniref:SKP1/ASK-interacting protein 16 n=1 Tax=Artemisia annua TaxID=35608 RepID=A0A2U1QIM6_ARTAN|nr:SKP1/ASK-interacting protein 16 [Artemisia annua]